MGSMMKSMTIGPKFILSISMGAFVAIAIGLFGLYQQEENKMDTMLGGRAQVLSQQILIGRSYIATNYAAKIKKSKAGSEIQVLKEHAGMRKRFQFRPPQSEKWVKKRPDQACIAPGW
jgi:methyl-accepting chemotaxis protein